MRFSNLFAGVAVAAAVLVTGAAAEAKKKPTAEGTDFKIRRDLKTGCPNDAWGTAPDGETCLPPGLARRLERTGALPRGLVKNGLPGGWRSVSP
jgi:hypothetical protein